MMMKQSFYTKRIFRLATKNKDTRTANNGQDTLNDILKRRKDASERNAWN